MPLMLQGSQLPNRNRRQNGKSLTLDFVYLDDDPVHQAIEDDVRSSLSEVGINVVARPLDKESFNKAASSGDFNLIFSETWGPPYDPHSFTAAFRTPNEAAYAAQQGMLEPMTKVSTGPGLLAWYESMSPWQTRSKQRDFTLPLATLPLAMLGAGLLPMPVCGYLV
jgi:hypothetical protein